MVFDLRFLDAVVGATASDGSTWVSSGAVEVVSSSSSVPGVGSVFSVEEGEGEVHSLWALGGLFPLVGGGSLLAISGGLSRKGGFWSRKGGFSTNLGAHSTNEANCTMRGSPEVRASTGFLFLRFLDCRMAFEILGFVLHFRFN